MQVRLPWVAKTDELIIDALNDSAAVAGSLPTA